MVYHAYRRLAGSFVVVLSLHSGFFPSHALAQPESRGEFGRWTLICDTPPGAPREQCAGVQSVLLKDHPHVGLAIRVLHTADGRNTLLQVVTSLGVWLPAGLIIEQGETRIAKLVFTRCNHDGCLAEIDVSQTMLAQLIREGMTTFVIFRTPEKGIGIPVSLDGFSSLFSRLRSK